jgi:glyoxylase-like metal-dependent hydrolase (beta-lactamase superfamily II)
MTAYKLQVMSVGEYASNVYLLIDSPTKTAALVDCGGGVETILDWAADVDIEFLLLTHGHHDHVAALDAVRGRVHAPVGLHPLDAEGFHVECDFPLEDGDVIELGDGQLEIVHIPGHTPGSVALKLREQGAFNRALVGDAIFPGGPGHTKTPSDLRQSLDSLAGTVFTWPDHILLLPGHGDPTTVGEEREDFERFRSGPLPEDLCGDVAWK